MAKRNKTKTTTSAKSNAPTWLTNYKLHQWLIFALGVLLYVNTIGHDFTLDDAIVITENEFTTQGISGVDELLQYDTFRGFFKVEGKESLVAGGRYRPLTPVLFAFLYQIFGATPWVFHVFNILLYAGTAMVLYRVLLYILSSEGKNSEANHYAYFVSLVTAMLFVIHPVHTEVVANVKGADEIVTLLGSLGAMYFCFKSYYESSVKPLLWAGLVFFLGLMAKETAITFLAVIPLALWFFTKASIGKIIKTAAPLLLSSVLFIGLRTAVLGFLASPESQELMNNPFLKLVGNQYVDFTFLEKFATIFYTLGKYIQLLIFPYPLSHDYYPRAIEIMNFSDWRVILSVLFYVGAGIYALIKLPKRDPISFGIWWYIATLSIASNIVFSVGTTMNERFIFIPSIGFALVVAILTYRIANRMTAAKKLKQLNQLKTVMAVLSVVVILFSVVTIVRNQVWKDNYTLFTSDVFRQPNSAKLRNSAAGALIENSVKPGMSEAARQKELTQAVEHLQEAIRIHPGYKNAYLLMGNAYNYLQQFELSIQAYQNALRLDPNYAEATNNLAVTYRNAGQYFGEQKNDLTKALRYLNKAYEMQPNEFETLRLLGIAYGVSKQGEKAIEFFERAAAINPNDANLLANLAAAYGQLGMDTKAQEVMKRALDINPNIMQERGR